VEPEQREKSRAIQRLVRTAPLYIGMNLQLDNKTARVTGSTAGIGLAIATTLTKEGAAVIVHGRTQKRGDEAVRNGDPASGIAVDLDTEAGPRAVPGYIRPACTKRSTAASAAPEAAVPAHTKECAPRSSRS
jgi:NAD(P)-dependent dehydrogenase (short-subunit alcohol dehydrogenase family)